MPWCGRPGLGDSRAFEALYRKHSRRVFAVVWRLSGGQVARAEDLVQDAFVRAWQALPNFRFESAFSTWLHRLAVNTALMEIRGRAGAEDLETDDAALDFVPTRDTAGQRTREQLDLERAVATLAATRARRAGAARHRRLETRRDFRGTGNGGRQLEGAAAPRAQIVARTIGRRP